MGLHDLPSVTIASGWDHLTSRLADPSKPEVVVRLEGEFDASNSETLLEQLRGVIIDDAVELTLDLSGVGFFSASSIGVIVQLAEKFRSSNRRLRLVSPSTDVSRVFRACGLSSMLSSSHLPDAGSSGELALTDEHSVGVHAGGSALASWVTVPKVDLISRRGPSLVESNLVVPQTPVAGKLFGGSETKVLRHAKSNSVGRGCY